MIDEIREHYRALDLEAGSSLEDVKQSWRILVKVWHPDRFPNDAKMQRKADEKLKEINLAYEELKKHLAVPSPQPPPPQASSTEPPPRNPSMSRPHGDSNDAANVLKMTCKECGGAVEFPEESEGATVLCPHCGKNLFLYRVNGAFNSKHDTHDFGGHVKANSPSNGFLDTFGNSEVQPFDKRTSLTGNQWEDILVVVVMVCCCLGGCGVLVGTQMGETPIHGLLFYLLLCALPIYFLPSYLAKRHKLNDWSSIFVLNAFAGWSIVGWIISFAWERKSYAEKMKAQPESPPKAIPDWQTIVVNITYAVLVLIVTIWRVYSHMHKD